MKLSIYEIKFGFARIYIDALLNLRTSSIGESQEIKMKLYPYL